MNLNPFNRLLTGLLALLLLTSAPAWADEAACDPAASARPDDPSPSPTCAISTRCRPTPATCWARTGAWSCQR